MSSSSSHNSIYPEPSPEPLTPAERCLLRRLAQGQTVTEAAAALSFTPEDAETLLADLLRRHGLSKMRRLIARALIHRWI